MAPLESLPQELIDLILAKLLVGQYSKKRADLLAIRSTSVHLYQSTHSQFANHFDKKLKGGVFQVTIPYLALLLQWTSIPVVRDKIESVTFVHGRNRTLKCESGKKIDNTQCGGHELSIKDPMAWQEQFLAWEERHDVENSTDTFHLLFHILENLKDGGALREINLEAAWEVTMAAVQASGIDQKIIFMKKLWNDVRDPGENAITVQQYLRDHAFRDRYNWDGEVERKVIKEDANGWHVTAKGSIGRSVLDYQLPHGLHTLSLYDVSVPEALLKKCLTSQMSVMRLDMICVNLTAGSWRKIFLSMQDTCVFEYMSIAHLRQRAKYRQRKHAKGRDLKIACSSNQVGVWKNSIRPFLEGLCRNFRLKRVEREFWFQVELLVVDGVSYEKSIDAPVRIQLDVT